MNFRYALAKIKLSSILAFGVLSFIEAAGQSELIFSQAYDARKPEIHTVAGFGRTQRQADRALVLAVTGAKDFQEEAAPEVKIPTTDYDYRLRNFPREGFFEFYACPYFNGKAPYDLAALSGNGKEILRLVLENENLLVTINGKTVKLSTKGWAARHYRHIQLVWKNGITRIFMERKEAATLDAAPAAADKLTFFAAFQGMIDEVSIGSGMPLVIDPDFDGDPEKFPRLISSAGVTDPSCWKIHQDIRCLPADKGGLRFTWKGGDGKAVPAGSAQCNVTWNVREDDYIRGDYAWTKERWNYGSQMQFYIEFLDAGGKLVKRQSIDSASTIKGYVFPMSLSEMGTESAIGVPMRYFNYYQVPKGADRIRFGIGFYGNPVTVLLSDVSFRRVDPSKQPWFREPYGKQKIHQVTRLSREEVDAVLKKWVRAVPELKRVGDRVEVFVDGKKTPLQILCNPNAGDYRWIDGFRKAGFPFYLTPVTVGRRCDYTESTPVWKENGEIDISVMEEAVRRIIRYNPDAMVFLNITVCPPRSWLESNRDELMVNREGEYAVIRDYAVRGLYSKTFPDKDGYSWYPSTASVKYRHDMANVLTKALTEFEKTDASKAVVGIYVTGGDDGQFRFPPLPDFSKPALDSYRAYLKSQGRSDADSAAMPDPQTLNQPPFPKFGSSPVADYWRWSTLVSYELRQFMYDAVKAAVPRVLVGGYENAMGLTGQPGFGRYKITELLNSRAPDFLISLPGYNRYRDDCDHPSGMKAYNGSMVLHKKLMIGEMDIRNPENGPLGINNRSRNWQATHNADTFRNFLALYASYCISWGGGFHAYLMQPLWWNTDEAVSAWARAAEITQQAEGQEPGDDRIAVFIDEQSSYYNATADAASFFTRIHYRESTEYSLWRSGVRCDYYVPSDVLHPEFKSPKILLFADAGTMKPETAAEIRKRYGRDGRLLIWVGHAGYLPEGNIETVRKITGFHVDTSSQALGKPLADRSGILWEPAFYAGGFPEPAWVVQDPDAETLAVYAGTKRVGMAMKKYADHTEVYLGQPGSLSPETVRTFARKVGIRPVHDRNDLAVMGGGLMEIGAMTGAGKRKIYFPAGVKNLKCLTGQEITSRGVDYIEIDLPYKDAAIFKMER